MVDRWKIDFLSLRLLLCERWKKTFGLPSLKLILSSNKVTMNTVWVIIGMNTFFFQYFDIEMAVSKQTKSFDVSV